MPMLSVLEIMLVQDQHNLVWPVHWDCQALRMCVLECCGHRRLLICRARHVVSLSEREFAVFHQWMWHIGMSHV